MAFKLPKYTELTDEQKIIVNLGYEKNILVSAAPGTGKTVVLITVYGTSSSSQSAFNGAISNFSYPRSTVMALIVNFFG